MRSVCKHERPERNRADTASAAPNTPCPACWFWPPKRVGGVCRPR